MLHTEVKRADHSKHTDPSTQHATTPTAAALRGHRMQLLQRGVEHIQGHLAANKGGQLSVLYLPNQPQRGHSHGRWRCG